MAVTAPTVTVGAGTVSATLTDETLIGTVTAGTAIAMRALARLAVTAPVVIVGAGLAGLGAAYELKKRAGGGKTCLLIDNHPVFGGEAKRNEFLVDGVRLIGPQGSNGFSVPPPPGEAEAIFAEGDAKYYEEFKIPRGFNYSSVEGTTRNLNFGRDNYGFIYWLEHKIDTGHFFRHKERGGFWVRNPLQKGFANAPVDAEIAAQLRRFMNGREKPYDGDDLDSWLDRLTYKEVIEDVLGYPKACTDYMDPIVASAIGLGCDATSAYGVYADGMPGVNGYYEGDIVDHRHSFPGGNDGFARYFLKAVMPHAIEGDGSFEAILNGRIRFHALDAAGQPFRMRLPATVVRVEHEGAVDAARAVRLTYLAGAKSYRVRAKGVVMAGGGWVNKHVVADLAARHRAAYDSFVHAPFLVANVALNNWRFMERLGITACRYNGEFGYSANLRQPMQVGDYRPPLHPDRPALLTFYVPFFYPGERPKAQGVLGRMELLSTSFADYELQIRQQMTELFSQAGFDARRDIAGVILNRWGHAFVAPGPGFYFGRDGQPAARDVVRRPFGRIAFGHSELRGNQHWGPAADEGARAMSQVIESL